MNLINEFLLKFKKISTDSENKNKIIIDIFKKISNCDIGEFKIKNNILFIKSNPYIKSEINLNKNKLLKELKKEGVEPEIIDIK